MAEDGAEAGLQAEGALEDQREHLRQLLDVQHDDDAGDDDVAQRHEGHDDFGEGGDALDSTEDDHAEHDCQHRRGGVGVDVHGVLQAGTDGVGLDAG
ncbi:hypothetical protein D3C72_1438130 [compost metagenome]